MKFCNSAVLDWNPKWGYNLAQVVCQVYEVGQVY